MGVVGFRIRRQISQKTIWWYVVLAPIAVGVAVWSFYLSMTGMLLILSIAMFVCGAAYQLWGLPKQALLNRRRGTVEGQTPVVLWSGAAAYGTGTFRALLMRDWWMVASRAPGMFWTVVILAQSFVYGRLEQEDEPGADDFSGDELALQLSTFVAVNPLLANQVRFVRNPDGSVSFEIFSGQCPEGSYHDLSVISYGPNGVILVNEMDDVH